MVQMEGEERRKFSPAAKAAKRAGRFVLAMAFWDAASPLIMGAIGMASSGASLVLGLAGAAVLGVLAWGTFQGRKKWALAGAGYYALESVVAIFLPGSSNISVAGIEMGEGMQAMGNLLAQAIVVIIMLRNALKMEW